MFSRQINCESGFNFLAYNVGSQASGAGQIVYPVHPEIKNPFDPKEALPYSARLMRSYYEYFKSDYLMSELWAIALACYNWGIGNVINAVNQFGLGWRQVLPEETRRYIQIILAES